MIGIKDLKNKDELNQILELNFPEQFKRRIYKTLEELLDLLGVYKAKRNLWEVKLKVNDDPGRPEFYSIIARLSMLDMMIVDLEYLIQLLSDSESKSN
ncbi:MAG: hypothetical protein ACFFB5_09925 [Promethearchaeota archaeon]